MEAERRRLVVEDDYIHTYITYTYLFTQNPFLIGRLRPLPHYDNFGEKQFEQNVGDDIPRKHSDRARVSEASEGGGGVGVGGGCPLSGTRLLHLGRERQLWTKIPCLRAYTAKTGVLNLTPVGVVRGPHQSSVKITPLEFEHNTKEG